ncbi:RluA family pseudouridine synthase [Candidatus Peregrinibacteria bacterium]|nr:RluA family pseudouridine synthase [Candidatus Peregrinibacteria bacterium]
MPINKERILYDDEYLLAVNKLSGELVVKGAGELGKLPLLDFLKKDYPGLQTLHRLDFETSGVTLFARSKKVATIVKESKFLGWKKVYRTIVVGRPRERGEIRIRLPVRDGRELVDALTTYHVLKILGDICYVECEIGTGRHHQIRRHFAGIGHPLVLDSLYGDRKFNQRFTQATGYRKFFLHASTLSFPHPVTGERIHIEAPLPRAFEEVLS